MANPHDDPSDALYASPPEGFVAARAALARTLRDAGDREGAARVRALRKPTRAAWAVNMVVRERPDAARELAEAAQALREAQSSVLAGGDAAELRAATERGRAAIDALASASPATDGATAEKVRATLHAATIDPTVLAAVLSGRLVHEQLASGFGGLPADDSMVAAPLRVGTGTSGRGARRGSGRAARAGEAGREQRARAREAERERRARARDAERERRARERAAREAVRAQERRRERLRRAQAAEAEAEADVTAARRALDQVESTIAARRADLRAAETRLACARQRREELEGEQR
jgi:hypothetical protein